MNNKPSIELEETIGYRFHNRYLLECALTHSSYSNEQKIQRYDNYERLEFLGDAVLEMISSAYLYEKYPEKREGDLSKMRASLVCEPSLAQCARDIDLEAYIRLGRGEEAAGGRNNASIISDVMEALIGAMYLDTKDIVEPRRFVLQFILNDLEGKLLFYDAKSVLQEECQKKGGVVTYAILDEKGGGTDKAYLAAVLVNGIEKARGSARSKKAAEQQAAYTALLQMQAASQVHVSEEY